MSLLAALVRNSIGALSALTSMSPSGYTLVAGKWITFDAAPSLALILALTLPLLFLTLNAIGLFALFLFSSHPTHRTAGVLLTWAKCKCIAELLTAPAQIYLIYWLLYRDPYGRVLLLAPTALASTVALLSGIAYPVLVFFLTRRPRFQSWLAARARYLTAIELTPRGIPL